MAGCPLGSEASKGGIPAMEPNGGGLNTILGLKECTLNWGALGC